MNHIEVLINNLWTKCNIISISGENNYIIKTSTDELIVSPEDIRIIISPNNPDSIRSAMNLQIYPDSLPTSIEYEIKPEYYIECNILQCLGNYYSLEYTNSIKVTRLSNTNSIRRIKYLNLNTYLNTSDSIYSNYLINIPSNIVDHSKFNEIVNNIPGIYYYNCYHNKLRIFCPKDSIKTIRLFIDIAISNELKLIKLEEDKIQVSTRVNRIKKELNKTQTYYISKDLIGLVIGVKGANILRLKQTYEVSILVYTDIPGDNALVTVSGEDDIKVEECLNEIKFIKVVKEFPYQYENDIREYSQYLIDKYKLVKCYVTKDKYKEEKRGVYYMTYINMIGLENGIDIAVNEFEEFIKHY